MSSVWKAFHRGKLRLGVKRLSTGRGQRQQASATGISSGVSDVEWEKAKPFSQIPGPRPLPIPLIGNIWRFTRFGEFGNLSDPTKLFEALNEKYGDIVYLSGLGRKPMVMLFNGEHFSQMYRHESPWPIRISMNCIEYYQDTVRKDLYRDGKSLAVIQGEEWHNFRSAVNPTMMQPRQTKFYAKPAESMADDFLERMREIRDTKQEMPSDFYNELKKWSLESMAFIALDIRLGCMSPNISAENQEVITSATTVLDLFYHLELQYPLWKYIKTSKWKEFLVVTDHITKFAKDTVNKKIKILESRKEDKGEPNSVLERLLKTQDPKFAFLMAMDMIFAGVDTTSTAMAVVLMTLAMNPEKQETLYHELKTLLPEKNTPITVELLNEMKYLKACIKESFRVNPIIEAHSRIIPVDTVIGGYQIPKEVTTFWDEKLSSWNWNEMLTYRTVQTFPQLQPLPSFNFIVHNIWAVWQTPLITGNGIACRSEKNFKNARQYIPERWLRSERDSEISASKANPFISLPFGFGPRMCIGRRFAELNMEMLTSKIIRNFEVSYSHGEMEWKTLIIKKPMKPLTFKMVDREN